MKSKIAKQKNSLQKVGEDEVHEQKSCRRHEERFLKLFESSVLTYPEAQVYSCSGVHSCPEFSDPLICNKASPFWSRLSLEVKGALINKEVASLWNASLGYNLQ